MQNVQFALLCWEKTSKIFQNAICWNSTQHAIIYIVLTHLSFKVSHKRDTGKQCQPRSDATKCDNNQNYPDTSYTDDGAVQRVMVEEFIQHK